MTDPSPIYRINKFIVPQAARDEFLATVIKPTHEMLRRQPGVVRDMVLEQVSGPGEFNIVAVVEFAGADAVPPIAAAVAEFHRRIGVDPSLTKRLGVLSDQGNYKLLPDG